MKAIHQFVDTFSVGDAIGNYSLQIREFIRNLGYTSEIYMDTIMNPRNDIHHWKELDLNDDQLGIIFHHSTLSKFVHELPSCKAKIMLVYHNITPSAFFKEYSFRIFKGFREAERQNYLFSKVNFAGVVGDSKYNLDCIEKYISKKNHFQAVFPPFLKNPVGTGIANNALVKRLKDGKFNMLFVGRVAPNKRHGDLLKLFEYYQKFVYQDCRLIITGNHSPHDPYFQSLRKFIAERVLENVVFTNKVGHEDLLSYYKASDIFISMSEHEGFCVPPLEAIHHKIPVIAYDIPAVHELLGGEYLFKTKDYVTISAMIEKIRTDSVYRKKMIEKQQVVQKKFIESKLKEDFRTIVSKTFSI